VAPLLATLAFLIVSLCFLNLKGSHIGSLNLWTAGIFLGTFFFPLCRSPAWSSCFACQKTKSIAA